MRNFASMLLSIASHFSITSSPTLAVSTTARERSLIGMVDGHCRKSNLYAVAAETTDKLIQREGKNLSRIMASDMTPCQAAAAEAVAELCRREGGKGEHALGAATSNGWHLVSRLEVATDFPTDPTTLWAVRQQSTGSLIVVASGWYGPEICTLEEVREEVRQRKVAVEAAEFFLSVVDVADASKENKRPEQLAQLFKQMDAERALRESVERRGEALIRLLDGQPVRVDGANLVDADGKIVKRGIQARRIDVGLRGPLTETPKPWPGEQQVWTRPVGPDVWRRGRLRLTNDSADFVDEPTATSPDRGDSKPSSYGLDRSLDPV
ncbi:hypothetical protein JMJ56_32890 [Belnapia sp. T18]|uniref:Uncharacterized protein n=1 Tax=Belnapia arida TaxID=2804533 RepID=A0ABS1UDK1_9PROT|nr:hypothetical protein [Belnapia arida]MBL6082753.1 hypothetical protein [Belnapia arida]